MQMQSVGKSAGGWLIPFGHMLAVGCAVDQSALVLLYLAYEAGYLGYPGL